MDMYQDIIIISKRMLDLRRTNKFEETQCEQPKESFAINENDSMRHLIDIHRFIIDSVHEIEIGSQIGFFHKMI